MKESLKAGSLEHAASLYVSIAAVVDYLAYDLYLKTSAGSPLWRYRTVAKALWGTPPGRTARGHRTSMASLFLSPTRDTLVLQFGRSSSTYTATLIGAPWHEGSPKGRRGVFRFTVRECTRRSLSTSLALSHTFPPHSVCMKSSVGVRLRMMATAMNSEKTEKAEESE